MKQVKTYTYDKDNSWQGYMDFVKEIVDRPLTKNEYESMLKDYIGGVKVENCAKRLKKENK